MKKISLKIMLVAVLVGGLFMTSSCTKDLLNQVPKGDVVDTEFWKSTDDAAAALNSVYSQARHVMGRDWAFDGHGEYLRYRSSVSSSQATSLNLGYRGGKYDDPSNLGKTNWNDYYRYSYGVIDACNYLIHYTSQMLEGDYTESVLTDLRAILGEARMIRGITYFRLICMFGHVPYIDWLVMDNSEVADVERDDIAMVKDKIYDDFTYAFNNMHNTSPVVGRSNRWAALAYRGKLQLYWACWKRPEWPWATPVAAGYDGVSKGGWPELYNFTADAAESQRNYELAAADFKKVMDESGIGLFRNGEPGEWGKMYEATTLPNYFHLFLPTANADPELMFGIGHGGTGSGQGEELMRDFGTRLMEYGQGWGQPRFEIGDRYQMASSGLFTWETDPLNPSHVPFRLTGYNTNDNPNARTLYGSAVNPESYRDRDYRMKSTLLWEWEAMEGSSGQKSTGWSRFQYKKTEGNITITNDDGEPVTMPAILADADQTGYLPRKYIRNYFGQGRSDGDYKFSLMRYADVLLMYAEASNEAYGPSAEAVEAVNKVRRRGNLPDLRAEKYADKETFFYAIEQERIIELFAEGQRAFDIRRWRSIERCWNTPQTPRVSTYDVFGDRKNNYFDNAQVLRYQQCYIFGYPNNEIAKNSKLRQNLPWE